MSSRFLNKQERKGTRQVRRFVQHVRCFFRLPETVEATGRVAATDGPRGLIALANSVGSLWRSKVYRCRATTETVSSSSVPSAFEILSNWSFCSVRHFLSSLPMLFPAVQNCDRKYLSPRR